MARTDAMSDLERRRTWLTEDSVQKTVSWGSIALLAVGYAIEKPIAPTGSPD